MTTRPGRDDLSQLRRIRLAEQAARPSRYQTTDRECLGCLQPFRSEWCGNRLCLDCKGGEVERLPAAGVAA